MLIHLTMSGNDGHVLLGDEFPANGVERGHLGLKCSFWKKGTCTPPQGLPSLLRGTPHCLPVSLVADRLAVVGESTWAGAESRDQ